MPAKAGVSKSIRHALATPAPPARSQCGDDNCFCMSEWFDCSPVSVMNSNDLLSSSNIDLQIGLPEAAA